MAVYTPTSCVPIVGSGGDWANWMSGGVCLSRGKLIIIQAAQYDRIDLTYNGVTEGHVGGIVGYTTCSATPSGYFAKQLISGSSYGLALDIFQAYDDGLWTSSVSIPYVVYCGQTINSWTFTTRIYITGYGPTLSPSITKTGARAAPAIALPMCSYGGSDSRGSGNITVYDDGTISVS